MNDSIYGFEANLLDGGKRKLSDYQGKVVLIVNTASYCGFTPQYAGLEKLQQTFGGQGFTVLAFPCNQFGLQEPGNAASIGEFCVGRYHVTFPVFEKIKVNGFNSHPLYRYLKQKAPGFLGIGTIKWNFTKFLIDRDGKVIARYAPSTTPEMIEADIRKLCLP